MFKDNIYKKYMIVKFGLSKLKLPKRLIEWIYKNYVFPIDEIFYRNKRFIDMLNCPYLKDINYDGPIFKTTKPNNKLISISFGHDGINNYTIIEINEDYKEVIDLYIRRKIGKLLNVSVSETMDIEFPILFKAIFNECEKIGKYISSFYESEKIGENLGFKSAKCAQRMREYAEKEKKNR